MTQLALILLRLALFVGILVVIFLLVFWRALVAAYCVLLQGCRWMDHKVDKFLE